MKKILKILGFIAGGFAALVLAAAVALPILFPPAKVKALIEKQAAGTFHRQVKLGKISVNLLSGLSVEMFALSELPDFSKGTFVSSDRFLLRPRLLPLLAKKIIIDDIRLVNPKISITRDKDQKTFNFSDLTAADSAQKPKETPSSAASPSLFLVSKATIENGTLQFTDLSPAQQSLTMDKLDLTVRNITLLGPVDLKTSFVLKTKGVELKTVFAGAVNLLTGSANIKQAEIKSGEAVITIIGETMELFKEAAFDLGVNFKNVRPHLLAAFAPLPTGVKLNGPMNGSATIKGSPQNLSFDTLLDLTSVAVESPGTFKKPANIPLVINAQGELAGSKNLALEKIKLSLESLVLSGWGNGTFNSTSKGSSYVFDLKSNVFPLEEIAKMMPSIQEYQLSGKTSVTAKVFSTAQGPDIKGTAHLQGASASVKGAKLSNIVSTIDFTMKDAAGKLTADELKHDYFSGKKLDAKWNLMDAADMAKISGTANMRMGPGEFQNIQKLTSDSKTARILFLPLSLLQKFSKSTGGVVKIPPLDNVAYEKITGDYVFKSGVMNITSFNLTGNIGASMNGTVGLSGTQPLDIKAQMKLKAGLIGGTIGEAFGNDQVQTSLNMIVKGTVEEPKVSIDIKDTGKKVLDTVIEKLGDKPEEKVKDLLKGLFKR